MKITINGKIFGIKKDTNIQQLIIQYNYQNKRLAVEVNQEIIPQSNYADFCLHNNDKVEIINAVGGG